MVVKIIIKRRVSKDIEPELRSLLVKIRNKAVEQPGYISGETLKNVEDPDETIVISTWQTLNDWKAWYSSEERAGIQNMIDTIIDEPTSYTIYQYS